MSQQDFNELVEAAKEIYPEDTRVELFRMKEPAGLPKGSTGTVASVDDAGIVHIRWDNGTESGAAYGTDSLRKIG